MRFELAFRRQQVRPVPRPFSPWRFMRAPCSPDVDRSYGRDMRSDVERLNARFNAYLTPYSIPYALLLYVMTWRNSEDLCTHCSVMKT
eukprot:6201804-Pleurochrysis_carterae.AAC.1